MSCIVTIGDAMVVMVAETGVPLRAARRFTRSVAGAEVNVAVGLARLGHDTRWVGRVGTDPLGDVVVTTLRGDGVDVSAVARDALPTGLMVRDAVADRQVQVVYHRTHAAGSRLSIADLPDDLVDDLDLLHVTGITGLVSSTARDAVVEAVGRARAAGVTVSVDPNLRWSLADPGRVVEVARELVGQADLVLAGADELTALGTGGAPPVDVLLDQGTQVVVTKLAAGARADSGLESVEVAVATRPVVDPVGAGDAFDAAFLDAWLRERSLREALDRGCRAGALVAGVPTDLDGLPHAGWTATADGDVNR